MWKHRVETDLNTSEQTELLVWSDENGELILPPEALRELTVILARQEKAPAPKPAPTAPDTSDDLSSFSPAAIAPPGLSMPDADVIMPPLPAMERTASSEVQESVPSSSAPEKLSLFKVTSEDEEEGL